VLDPLCDRCMRIVWLRRVLLALSVIYLVRRTQHIVASCSLCFAVLTLTVNVCTHPNTGAVQGDVGARGAHRDVREVGTQDRRDAAKDHRAGEVSVHCV
jgi:hypothetical protein